MIGIMVDQKLEHLESKIKYTCGFIFETLGFPYRYINSLDYNRKREIIFLCSLMMPSKDDLASLAGKGVVVNIQIDSDLLMPDKLSKDFIQKYVKEIRLFNSFPVITRKSFDNPIEVTKGPDYYWGEINFDIIGNIFFHLAGLDEKISGQNDNWGRVKDESLSFLSYAKVAYVNNMLWMIDHFIKDIVEDNPYIPKRSSAKKNNTKLEQDQDDVVRDFFDNLKDDNGAGNYPLWTVKKDYWPGGEDFAYIITHNIDRLQKWSFTKILSSTVTDLYLAVGLKFPPLFRNIKEKIWYLITNTEYYWKFDDIQEVLSKFSAKATWFVGAMEEGDETEIVDYVFDDNDLKDRLRDIVSAKGEVALLTDDICGSNLNPVLNQKKRLSNFFTGRVKGMRNVQGKFDSQTSFTCLKKTEMLYDASKSFNEQAGFRDGIAFPYQPYQPEETFLADQNSDDGHINYKGSQGNWEVPMMFSDSFLQVTKCKFISKDRAMDIVKTLVNTIKETNGLLTFNFSISNFNDISYLSSLMEYTLKLLKAKNLYTGTMGELIEWWTKRRQVELKIKEDSFVLKSPQDIEQLSLRIYGNRKIDKHSVKGASCTVRANQIILTNIKKDKEVLIKCPPDDQQYLKIGDY